MTGAALVMPPEGAPRAQVITCSDSAAREPELDRSGPLAVDMLQAAGMQCPLAQIVTDDQQDIVAAVRAALAGGAEVVVLTGGTGIGPRDRTPEALSELGLQVLPGVGEAIRATGRRTVATADLSRSVAGVLTDATGRRTLVLALPGSPGGVRDGLEVFLPMAGHALHAMLGGGHGPREPRATGSGAGPADPDPADSVAGGDRAPAVPASSGPAPWARAGQEAANPVGDEPSAGLEPITWAWVGDGPLVPAALEAVLARPEAGAYLSFVGRVRDHDGGRGVASLKYEGHPRAGEVLMELVREAARRPEILGAAAGHRVGELAVGEVAFAAVVCAAHRQPAFAACESLVEAVKARLPVWKHQVFTDGSQEWVNCP